MAAGDTIFVFLPQNNVPPSANYATVDTFAAATGLRMVLDFDGAAADETAIFEDAWPSWYDGGGCDVFVHFSTNGTDTDVVQFEASFEVTVDDDDQDGAGKDFGTATDINGTPKGEVNKLVVTSASVTHANCGSPSAGNAMRFKLTRDFDHAANTNDAQVHRVVITES